MNRKTQSVDTLRISTARNHISSTPILKDLKISRIKGLIAPGTRIKKRRNTKSMHFYLNLMAEFIKFNDLNKSLVIY